MVSGQINALQRGQYETGGIPSTGFGLAVMNFMGRPEVAGFAEHVPVGFDEAYEIERFSCKAVFKNVELVHIVDERITFQQIEQGYRDTVELVRVLVVIEGYGGVFAFVYGAGLPNLDVCAFREFHDCSFPENTPVW